MGGDPEVDGIQAFRRLNVLYVYLSFRFKGSYKADLLQHTRMDKDIIWIVISICEAEAFPGFVEFHSAGGPSGDGGLHLIGFQ